MSYKPIDGAKEDFRRYLDRKGVMDTLTKAFIACYDDRPENPIERVLEVLSDTSRQLPSNYRTKLETAELQLAEARAEIDVLRKQLESLGVKPAEVQKPMNTVSAGVPTPSTPALSSATVAAAAAAAAAVKEEQAAEEPKQGSQQPQQNNTENEESAKPEATVVEPALVAPPTEPSAVPATTPAPAEPAVKSEEQPSTST